jgi:hypothetical protein
MMVFSVFSRDPNGVLFEITFPLDATAGNIKEYSTHRHGSEVLIATQIVFLFESMDSTRYQGMGRTPRNPTLNG